MNHEVDIGPELNNLKERLESDLDKSAKCSAMGLNTLIYYFERFLEQHKKYEETKHELLMLDIKLKQLSGEENEES